MEYRAIIDNGKSARILECSVLRKVIREWHLVRPDAKVETSSVFCQVPITSQMSLGRKGNRSCTISSYVDYLFQLARDSADRGIIEVMK